MKLRNKKESNNSQSSSFSPVCTECTACRSGFAYLALHACIKQSFFAGLPGSPYLLVFSEWLWMYHLLPKFHMSAAATARGVWS